MDGDETSVFGGGLRPSYDTAIEESGLFGTRRRWTHVSRIEMLFLLVGVLAAIATDGLTIYRLTEIEDKTESDLAYGILILINSIFLLLFLFTGILQQRVTDIVTFFISAVLLTAYVVTHFLIRLKNKDEEEPIVYNIRLARLICTIVFNVCFIPLSIFVIRDYQRDEYSKRLFGVFPTARWPLKIYNIFDCVARVNTMLCIASFLLNLYNFNAYETTDEILLGIGIPITLLWLALGVGMVRVESRLLVVVFCLTSLFQPGFIGYCLHSAITHPSSTTTATTTTTTTASFIALNFTATVFSNSQMNSATSPPNIVSVLSALYVCVGLNIFTHILSIVCGFLCIRNFGKGLKERVFNNRADKFFQKTFSRC